MARSINSPGVQITEKDLSEFIQTTSGTSVFAMGFAAQGPTDEVLAITSVSELENVYGAPVTAAEKYFHYTSREILNSSARLLTTRLPYGSGAGVGFENELYSALLYPVLSSSNSYTIGEPTHITFDEGTYVNILQNNINWEPITASTTITPVVSTITVVNAASAAVLVAVSAIDSGVTFTNNLDLSSVTLTFNVSTTSTTFITSSATFISNVFNVFNTGIVVLNSAQTTINEGYEGYYVALTDNTNIGPDTNFASVVTFKSLSASNDFVAVTDTRLGFDLSGSKESLGVGSISEIIESIPTYEFGSDFFKDSLIMTVFKVRSSTYETGTLASSLVESYIGSLDPNKKTVTSSGVQTYFLEDLVNNRSNNVKVLINPAISKQTNWVDVSSVNPSTSVRVADNNKALYSVGTYVPTYSTTNKYTGRINLKVERALALVESAELVDLDVIVDGGLSTISAVVSSETGEFDDSVFIKSGAFTNLSTRWKDIFNKFNNFAQNTRKDCMFISDPLRSIFVNGANTKKSSLKDYIFSTDTYTPLKTLFSGIETNYSATYGNWVKVFDVYSDRQIWVPTSGFAAAAFARTDATAQPWIAPAGLTRGVINNVVDIAFNPNQKQRDFLYPISINPVVFFNTDGYVIFGQKTLQTKPSAFDRINVRRLFLALEKSVLRSLRFFVFEPNTEFTRTRLRNTITPVFELAKNTEGIFDYLIVCDERNNTPDTIDRNELNVDIYIKPVRAAEFILVNFIATRTGQNFQELI